VFYNLGVRIILSKNYCGIIMLYLTVLIFIFKFRCLVSGVLLWLIRVLSVTHDIFKVRH